MAAQSRDDAVAASPVSAHHAVSGASARTTCVRVRVAPSSRRVPAPPGVCVHQCAGGAPRGAAAALCRPAGAVAVGPGAAAAQACRTARDTPPARGDGAGGHAAAAQAARAVPRRPAAASGAGGGVVAAGCTDLDEHRLPLVNTVT